MSGSAAKPDRLLRRAFAVSTAVALGAVGATGAFIALVANSFAATPKGHNASHTANSTNGETTTPNAQAQRGDQGERGDDGGGVVWQPPLGGGGQQQQPIGGSNGS